MLGFSGNEVRKRKYCDSKTKEAADESNSTSPEDARVMLNEKGFNLCEYLIAAELGSTSDPDIGRGNTESGIW
jgi:hypothetical protein